MRCFIGEGVLTYIQEYQCEKSVFRWVFRQSIAICGAIFHQVAPWFFFLFNEKEKQMSPVPESIYI